MTAGFQKTGFRETGDFLAQIRQDETLLPLKHEACRSRFFLHAEPTAKVFLFFHGFTAGPYQFEPIGQAFFKAGYNVLVPLQPGHGQAGTWNAKNPPPLPTDIGVYQQFALHWLQLAQTLGQQVIVGGLSTGGTLSAWLAFEQRAVIDRALLFTPYLGSYSPAFDWLIKVMPLYFEWFNKDEPGNFGYQGFRIPALRIFLNLAHSLFKQARTQTSAPVLMVSSESDVAVSRSRQQQLFRAILAHQPRAWYYCFDDSLQIHHRMMTRVEGNEHEDLVIALAKAYVESELTWNNLNQIAAQISQGEDYEAIVRNMTAGSQVSPDLLKVITQSVGCDQLSCITPA